VLEIRPAVAGDKGTAVRALVGKSGAQLGLYAGDDATDLDAFRGLAEAGLEHAVRVAVASSEAPLGLIEEADVTVADPAALLELLRLL
jgi:trehalose 6-phosphate phosphatase